MTKRNSDVEDMIELAAKMPWWINIILAVGSYLILHHYATRPNPPTPTEMNQLGDYAVSVFWPTLAMFGQYLMPFIFTLAAIGSLIKRVRSQRLLQRIEQTQNYATEIRSMTSQDFERLIGAYFRQQGYRVSETAEGADGGIDLILRQGTEKYFVQCKHWKAQKVGVNIVRELYGVMSAQGASGGFVITSGTFTADARKYVHGLNIELIDGIALQHLFAQAKSAIPAEMAVDKASSSVPRCPACGNPMVKRIARQGKHAGESFWGCSAYPKCKTILPFSTTDTP